MNERLQKEITVVDGVEYVTENGILCGVNMRQEIKTLNIPDTVQGVGRFLGFHVKFSLQEIRFPDTVHTLPEGLLESSWKLCTVRLPSGISEIPKTFFRECYKLEEITVPEGVTAIGDCAFGSCTHLEKITVPSSLTSIGKNAFYMCSALGQITLPEGLTFIGDCAFEYSGLEELRIPDGVKTLPWKALNGCKKLKRLIHGPDLQWTGDWVHIGIRDAETVTVPEGVEVVGESACWEYAALKELILPASVKRIRYGAFNMCRSLQTVQFAEGLRSIDHIAFRQCESLSRIDLPMSLTEIDKDAFELCSSLTEVVIPPAVQSIGANAFAGCTGLTRVKICNPACQVHPKAFANCLAIQSFEFDGEGREEILHHAHGIRIEGGILKEYSGTAEELTVPDGVTAIGASAFQNCEKLTRVVLPDSVTGIGRFAFKGCTALGEVVIPASVQTICGALFAEGTPSLRILYAGSSARWEGMMKQEENTVKLFYDDGYHHGRGLNITYVEYYPIFFSSYEDFVCEVHCLEDGKTLVYHREEPIPDREIERYDNSI